MKTYLGKSLLKLLGIRIKLCEELMQDNISLEVEGLSSPCRIDKYIYDEVQSLSRNRVQQLISDGSILLNAKAVKKNTKVFNGDTISVTIPEAESAGLMAQDIPLDIVYEDKDLIVVNKPRGMVVHPAPGHPDGTLVNALMYHMDSLSSIGGYLRPGIVHRIDRDTTGLLMVAKNDIAHASLSSQLKERSVGRIYMAIVHGGFSQDEGIVDLPIGRDKKNRLKMAPDLGGRPALTRYKLVEKIGNYSLLQLKLESGRTHQIRVHMKHIKHPLIGDPLYGSRSDKYVKFGQFLHAKTLEFDHPRTGDRMKFDSDLPDEFLSVLEELRRKC